jgi:NTP pyrophosphatase (non-canonical NTP hydrolase)
MKESLLKIVNHYGLKHQLKYIHSEYYELDEAIIIEEDRVEHMKSKNWNTSHIAEELSDCFVMLKQFQYYYEIPDEEIERIMKYKIKRQLERIDKENN